MINLDALKKDKFIEALGCSLSVKDGDDNKIAKLVPIGNWALNDSELLSSFAAWRQTFMRFFFNAVHCILRKYERLPSKAVNRTK